MEHQLEGQDYTSVCACGQYLPIPRVLDRLLDRLVWNHDKARGKIYGMELHYFGPDYHVFSGNASWISFDPDKGVTSLTMKCNRKVCKNLLVWKLEAWGLVILLTAFSRRPLKIIQILRPNGQYLIVVPQGSLVLKSELNCLHAKCTQERDAGYFARHCYED